MSFSCITNYLSANLQFIQKELANGECLFLAAPSAPDSNEYGFSGGDFTPRTTGFFPCTWTAKKLDEKLVGDQSRALAGYEITVALKFDGEAVVVKPSDRIELKMNRAENQTQIFEIAARINQSNVCWMIYAVDIDDEH